MTLPLWVLAALAVVGGFFGLAPVVAEALGTESWIHGWLVGHGGHPGPVAELSHEVTPSHAVEWGLLALGALIAIGGVSIAWFVVRWGARGPEADRSVRRLATNLYAAASKKWGWDEGYNAAIVNPIVRGSRQGLAPFDRNAIDGAVNGLARSVRSFAGVLRGVQTGAVQTYALAIVLGVVVVVALVMFV